MGDKLDLYRENAITFGSSFLQNLVSGLISNVFMGRNTASAELEKLKAGKFNAVIDNLLDNGKMTYTELYKCHNFFKVAQLADEIDYGQENQREENGNPFDFDWLMRFYDAVGNISNEELQQLWGRVLAGKINKPKSCSLRTLDIVRNLSAEEARAFNSICKFVLHSGFVDFVLPMGFYDKSMGYQDCYEYIKSIGMSYTDVIMPLLEAGLLTSNHDLSIYLEKGTPLEFHNDKVVCIVESYNDEAVPFSQSAYFLTTSGVELYRIISNASDFLPDDKYAILCFKHMKRDNPDLSFSAYEVTDHASESKGLFDLL